MCVEKITGSYDIAKIILGCSLPECYEFVYVIVALVIGIVFVACIFAPFWFVYKLFDQVKKVTQVIQFLINFIVGIFELALSLKFELFGHQVSVMSIQLAAIVMILFVSFYKNETPGVLRMTKKRFSGKENKKDKKNDYTPKHTKKPYEPRHGKE